MVTAGGWGELWGKLRLKLETNGHHCNNCNRENHIESVCPSSQNKVKTIPNEESERVVFDSLCAATVSQQRKEVIKFTSIITSICKCLAHS